MTTQELRDLFNNSGLSYNNVTRVDINRLRSLLIIELKEFRKENKISIKISTAKNLQFDGYGKLILYYLTVDTNKSERIEGLSLYKDGSISFAGWAAEGSIEIKPFQKAFELWINELSEKYAKSIRPLDQYPFSKKSKRELIIKKNSLKDHEKSIKKELQLIEKELNYREKIK